MQVGNVNFSLNNSAMSDAVLVAQGKKQGSMISGAAKELVSRSADESYATLEECLAACLKSRELSRQATVNLAELTVSPEDTLSMRLPNGKNARLTHYSLGQLVRRIGYNALGLVNRLPAQLASDVINEGLRNVAIGSVGDTELTPWESDAIRGRPVNANGKILWRENGICTLDSITNASYGRFFDAELAEFAVKCRDQNNLCGLPTEGIIRDDIKGSFLKGDRDCFIVLRDNNRRIFEKDPNGGLSRMLMLGNSEVESRPLTMQGLFYSYVCANWNAWDATEAFNVVMRHSKNLRENFRPDDMLTAIKAFFEASPEKEEAFITSAKNKVLGASPQECIDTLLGLRLPMLGKKSSKAVIELAEIEEKRYGNPRAVWGIANSITQQAQDAKFTNVRVALQDCAKEVFALAA